MRGSKAHQKLITETANEFKSKGYTVVLDGERSKINRYRGVQRVDIIAENDKEVCLIECGWISDLERFRILRQSLRTFPFSEKKIKLIWIPYIYNIYPQKSVLDK